MKRRSFLGSLLAACGVQRAATPIIDPRDAALKKSMMALLDSLARHGLTVPTNRISYLAVTTSKIADHAITASKLRDGPI